MEIGAVKQAFNNEVISMKKNLNQAKIQIIHKLTRKAKTLAEKKTTEKLKEKLKKKAESAVKEVLIIKKLKAKDIAKFIVTHDGELKSFLNTPQVNQDKACARLLLHKSLQEKYRSIRDRFGNSSIEDLLMSRIERRKLKKEAREKQKNKKKGKEQNTAVNAEGTWDVEEIENHKKGDVLDDHDDDENKSLDNESAQSADEVDNSALVNELDDNSESELEKVVINGLSECDGIMINDTYNRQSDSKVNSNILRNTNTSVSDKITESKSNLTKKLNKKKKEVTESSESEHENTAVKKVNVKSKCDEIVINDISNRKESSKVSPNIINKKAPAVSDINIESEFAEIKGLNKKKKEGTKNKNFNEKILNRKFSKGIDEQPAQEVKVVDPFFITTTGESYLSVVEPRQPDEVKDIHKQGNRKYRRAVMFGHVPKPKHRRDFKEDNRKFNDFNNKFNNNNDSRKETNQFWNKNSNEKQESEKEEKLHPSWEAKKRKSGILPFEGKKIVFDDGE